MILLCKVFPFPFLPLPLPKKKKNPNRDLVGQRQVVDCGGRSPQAISLKFLLDRWNCLETIMQCFGFPPPTKKKEFPVWFSICLSLLVFPWMWPRKKHWNEGFNFNFFLFASYTCTGLYTIILGNKRKMPVSNSLRVLFLLSNLKGLIFHKM